jgi:hypothetical protein
MGTRTGHRQIALAGALVVSLAIGAPIVGCGGASHSSRNASSTKIAKPRKSADRIPARYMGLVRRAISACERAVQAPPGLSAEAKSELADLCFRVNYVQEDNEATVQAACQEAANASSLTGDARERAALDCYKQGFVRSPAARH